MEVDEALVDLELVAIPGLGTLTARLQTFGVNIGIDSSTTDTYSLTGGDLEDLGGETDGALDAEILVLGAGDEVTADLLEVLDVAAGQGDANLVDLGRGDNTLDVLIFGDVAHDRNGG